MKTIKEIYDYREMIFSLVRKDLRGRYLGSVLGFFWTFLNPLLQLAVYSVVFSFIMRANIDKYYLFLFVALIPWMFFSTCLVGGSTAVLNEPGLITKIYFPREVLPISFVTSSFVNMLLCFVVVFAVVLFSGVTINLALWPLLLFIMAIEYFMGLGIALFSSAVTVYFRDLQHILSIVQMAWMYMTPVLYDVEQVPDQLQFVLMLNPMTPIITAYRDILYYAQMPNVQTVLSALLFAVVVCAVGAVTFGRLKRGFAEEL